MTIIVALLFVVGMALLARGALLAGRSTGIFDGARPNRQLSRGPVIAGGLLSVVAAAAAPLLLGAMDPATEDATIAAPHPTRSPVDASSTDDLPTIDVAGPQDGSTPAPAVRQDSGAAASSVAQPMAVALPQEETSPKAKAEKPKKQPEKEPKEQPQNQPAAQPAAQKEPHHEKRPPKGGHAEGDEHEHGDGGVGGDDD